MLVVRGNKGDRVLRSLTWLTHGHHMPMLMMLMTGLTGPDTIIYALLPYSLNIVDIYVKQQTNKNNTILFGQDMITNKLSLYRTVAAELNIT